MLLLAQAPTLLTQRQHGISLECLDVLALQLLIVYGYFAHSFAGLRLELTVVEVDQLVAEAVDVAAEPSLPRQNVIVVVDVLVQEGTILQLFRCVVRLQLTFCQRRTDRCGLVGLCCVKLPELTPDFGLKNGGWYELAIAFEVDVDPECALARVYHILSEVLVHDHEDLVAEQRVRLQVLVQVEQVQNVELIVLVYVQYLEAEEKSALFVLSNERNEPFNEFGNGNLDAIVALCHPQVQALAEVRLVYAYHVLNVPHEVRLCEDCHPVDLRIPHLILTFLAP